MKFKEIFQKIFGIKQRSAPPVSIRNQEETSEKMQKMLTMLSNTENIELTCEEVFAVLDQFAELAAHGEDVSKLMPLVQHHLDMCPDCQDEYRVLKNIVLNTAY